MPKNSRIPENPEIGRVFSDDDRTAYMRLFSGPDDTIDTAIYNPSDPHYGFDPEDFRTLDRERTARINAPESQRLDEIDKLEKRANQLAERARNKGIKPIQAKIPHNVPILKKIGEHNLFMREKREVYPLGREGTAGEQTYLGITRDGTFVEINEKASRTGDPRLMDRSNPNPAEHKPTGRMILISRPVIPSSDLVPRDPYSNDYNVGPVVQMLDDFENAMDDPSHEDTKSFQIRTGLVIPR